MVALGLAAALAGGLWLFSRPGMVHRTTRKIENGTLGKRKRIRQAKRKRDKREA